MIEAPFERFIKTYAKDEVVFTENSPGKEMLIVYSGKINLYKEQQDKRVLLATVGTGDTLAANKIELQDEFVTQNKYRNILSNPFYAHLWLEDGILIDLGNCKLQVIHTPGHTSGCICLYELKEKVLFSGDTVFAGGLLSDISGSGNISDYLGSLQRLGNLKMEALYPGHGLISSTPEEDMCQAVEYARTVMGESKLLFEALARSESRAKVLERLEKAPLSGMARPTIRPKNGS